MRVLRKDATLVRQSIDRVSLSFGNWMSLIGMVAALLLAIVGTHIRLINRIGTIETINAVQNTRLDQLEGGGP